MSCSLGLIVYIIVWCIPSYIIEQELTSETAIYTWIIIWSLAFGLGLSSINKHSECT